MDSTNIVDTAFIEFAKNNPVENMKIPTDLWVIPELTVEKCYEETAKYWIEKPKNINYDALRKAKEMLRMMFMPYVKNAGVVTVAEVINEMELGTSPGYSHNRSYIDKMGAVFSDRFREEHFRFVLSVLSGYPIPEVFMSTLKWELRKKGKNPRTFMTGALHMHVCMAQLYKRQNDSLTKYQFNTWYGVGLSPFKGVWDEMCNKVIINGGDQPLFIAADVSGWDRDVPPELLEAAREVMFSLLPVSDRTWQNEQMSIMLENMNTYGPVLLPNGEVVIKKKGMASGTFVTISRNTQAHALVEFYAFIKMIPGWETMTPQELYEKIINAVWLKLTGDDQFGSINTAKYKWFDRDAYVQAYADFGFTLKIIEVTRKLEQLSGFLSCVFTVRCHRWVALPNREKVLCQIAFGGKSTNPKNVLMRILSIRQNAWPDPQLFAMLNEYIRIYMRVHRQRLEVDKDNEITHREIVGSFLPSDEVANLHLVLDGSFKYQPF